MFDISPHVLNPHVGIVSPKLSAMLQKQIQGLLIASSICIFKDFRNVLRPVGLAL